jgi:hypothetical protein
MVARGGAVCEPWVSAKDVARVARGRMSLVTLHFVLVLAIGFAFAGLCASGYQLVTEHPPSFRLLGQGPRPSAFAAIPLLAFAAPFIIMRNTIRGRHIEGRPIEFVMLATVIAGFWSLMSGTLVISGLQALGVLVA